jgi:hypothetical protein
VLIIDGGRFTNAISSYLVVALFLSMWRLPTPCYIQWMNQNGTLKITHNVRVTFLLGNYIDIVDCDDAPLSACHLLLGRPWQYDLDATHGGHSNSFSFVHKGVSHVLKPTQQSNRKAEGFILLKRGRLLKPSQKFFKDERMSKRRKIRASQIHLYHTTLRLKMLKHQILLLL